MNFPRIFALLVPLLVLGRVRSAAAQTYGSPGGGGRPAGQVGSSGLDAYPGDGVRLSDAALLHLGVGAEAGYDTNVFYDNRDNSARAQSAILVVTPFVDLSNSLRQSSAGDGSGLQPFLYHLGASLAYRQYLTDRPDVKDQTAFIPTVSASLAANGARSGFAVIDTFTRIEEPPYGAQAAAAGQSGSGEQIKRNHNVGIIQVSLSPGGGRITSRISYTNVLDMFETTTLKYGNNLGHTGNLDTSWKWLPKTALFLRLTGGYVQYLNKSSQGPSRSDSVPLSAGLGIRGLITPKMTASVDLGYGTAFYLDRGTHVSGIGNINAGVSLGFKLGYATSLGLGYGHGFRNSPIVGDYYNLDSVSLGISQSLGGRLVFSADGRYEWRRYQGATITPMGLGPAVPFERRDNIILGQAKLDFFVQRWLYTGIGYIVSFNQSNADPANGGTDYVKNQILGRAGVTY